ncbi:zinc-dependent metalloprotease [Blastococcus sp. CCUG 61487]|uniref:zinc-dependent metalloprotease n=1 Tax=Blastococcus sp. CCUG 61487 TaxID=1840703 RepID=UPI0010C14CB5|nr:zinc-dependent metalloprotease [Blastococcus sp. CCUG 61487]TKJ32059.1 hydrolase [Blastococcus sp. CCUG 61487]
MSDVPFGFGLPDRDPERRGGDQPGGGDPFGLGALFGGIAGGGSPEDVLGKMPLFAELQKLMSWSGGPVNWDLAKQSAISQLAAGHQPSSDAERTAVAESLRLADLWLDQVTELPSGIERTAAWSRVEWVEQTLPAWGALIDPLAERVVAAMTSALPQEAAMSFGPIAGIMGRMGGLMFGAQVGSALGKLADEVLTSTDVGLPLAPAGTGVLVPQNVAEFASGLDRPADEVRLFLALREAASQRLFAHVPWLRQQLQDAVHAYARGITIDREAIERGIADAMGGGGLEGLDPSDPESIQRLLGSGVLEPEETPEQQMALRRLETLLALVEGWVDTVVAEAAKDRLPGHSALAETMRRRRASGGPAEQTFATLVGLQLRPRRLRDAAVVWAAMGQKHGSAERDQLWNHPDLLPTSDDLDEPMDFVARHGLDDELRGLTAADAERDPEE